MSKMNELFKRAEKAAAEKAANDAKVEEIKNSLEALRTKEEAALTAGDREEVQRIRREMESLALDYSIATHKIFTVPVTPEEIEAIWNDYSKSYEAQMAKAWNGFEEAEKKLRDSFEEILGMRNDALKNREKLATIAGVTPGHFSISALPRDPMKRPDGLCRFFLAEGLWTYDRHTPSPSSTAWSAAWSIANNKPVDRCPF